jgi:hypothetical protein
MKEIKLSCGRVTRVDDEDFELLSQWQWYLRGGKYVGRSRRIGESWYSEEVRLHRVITNAPKGLVVDHINHDTLDNRRSNLRVCTYSQNLCNRGAEKGKAGFKGVYVAGRKYRSIIRNGGRLIFLGSGRDEESLARIFDRAAIAVQGDFAYTNFPREQYDVGECREELNALLRAKGIPEIEFESN